jgi:hypothetical protein
MLADREVVAAGLGAARVRREGADMIYGDELILMDKRKDGPGIIMFGDGNIVINKWRSSVDLIVLVLPIPL